MRLSSPPRLAPLCALFLMAVTGLYACSEAPVEPSPPQADPLFAKPGGAGAPKVEVESVDPPSAPQGTRLVVTVEGSGYDESSSVTMLIDRKPSDKVRTNSTTVLSDTKLEADITIDAEAVVDLYDVEVTAQGGRKKGVGAEKFGVTSSKPVSALVTDPASGAGVYSDEFSGSGYAVYTPVDGVTTRVDLKVLCTRELNLALPTSPAAIGILDGVSIPTCNDPGWMFLRLADLTTMGACSEGTCWPSHPSYTTNRNGKVRPTGAFAPNLHFFFSVPDDAHYDFVWTDGAVALEDLNGTEVKHVTANNAHLYRGGMNPVCAPDPAPDQVDQDLCPGGEARVDFFLPLDVKVVEGSTWPGP